MEGVLIDTCIKCAGVWLDARELERLSEPERPRGTWLNGLWGKLSSE